MAFYIEFLRVRLTTKFKGAITLEIFSFIFMVFVIFFIIAVANYMRKTFRQREDQIAQMDRFIELYKNANGLIPVRKNEETAL